MTKLWYDCETYSATPIAAGAYRYAETAEIMIVTWAIDDGPIGVVDVANGDALPGDLVAALLDPDVEVWAHNSMFDRAVMSYYWPMLCPPIERWRDTLVQAAAHALPLSLEHLGAALALPTDTAKDKRGADLIQLFCKPMPKSARIRRATKLTHPEKWAIFCEYAATDIAAMRECHRRMPKWNYPNSQFEVGLWHLDQRINDRGIAIDEQLVRGALTAVEAEQLRLAKRVDEHTEGEVASATQRNAMMAFIAANYGVVLDDLRGATVERLIDDPDTPAPLRALLALRQQASTTSTAKYKALARATNRDNRLRGTLQFGGATRTMRWSGRVFQPQNLPRPTLKQAAIDSAIARLRSGDTAVENPMAAASSALRGCLVTRPGRKMVVADLSNIEGRGLAYLAGEQWKLDAFAEFDTLQLADGGWVTGAQWREAVLAGSPPALALDAKGEHIHKGFDLYKLAYAKSFSTDPAGVTKDQRQVGKVQELALGYASGVNGFATFALVYGIDLDDLADKVLVAAPAELVQQATAFLEWRRRKEQQFNPGMSDRAFIACDTVKRGWREGHPNITAWWPQLESAFRAAIDCEGKTYDCGTVRIRRDGDWLRMRLPSGRYVCYPKPSIDSQGRCSYAGTHQQSRKWGRLQTYSGKIAENATQAFARDVLAYNMPAIEAAGYQIVLSVHDELLTEAPDSPEFNADHLSALMATVPPWAEGLPLAAAGFEAYRYRKD